MSSRGFRTPYRADAAAPLAFVASALVVFGTAALSGGLGTLWDPASAILVLAGTITVTAVATSPSEVLRALGDAARALGAEPAGRTEAVREVLALAERARKTGARGLEDALGRLKRVPALFRAMSLAADGVEAAEIETVLRLESDALRARFAASGQVFRRAAELAPALGLIGTLLGLVRMLGSLTDPASIGPGMALALLTTLYGAVLANMICAPLAWRLERMAEAETRLADIYAAGSVAIARADSRARLERALGAMLSPEERIEARLGVPV